MFENTRLMDPDDEGADSSFTANFKSLRVVLAHKDLSTISPALLDEHCLKYAVGGGSKGSS